MGFALFSIIAASTVIVPVVGYLIAGDRLDRPLAALRAWIIRHAAGVVTIVLIALGVSMVLTGIQSL